MAEVGSLITISMYMTGDRYVSYQVEHMDAIRLSCEGIPVDDNIGLVGNGLDIRHKLNVHFLLVSGRRWHQYIVLRE